MEAAACSLVSNDRNPPNLDDGEPRPIVPHRDCAWEVAFRPFRFPLIKLYRQHLCVSNKIVFRSANSLNCRVYGSINYVAWRLVNREEELVSKKIERDSVFRSICLTIVIRDFGHFYK